MTDREAARSGTNTRHAPLPRPGLPGGEPNELAHLDNLPVAVYRCTPTGAIRGANREAVALFGYPDFTQLRDASLLPDSPLAADRRRFADLVKRRGTVRGVESELLRPDATRLWVREDARGVIGNHGELLFVEGALTDISEVKAVQAERAAAEERLRWVVQSLPIAIFSVDENHVLRFIGGKGMAVFGHEAEDMVGRPTTEFELARLVREAAARQPGPPLVVTPTGRSIEFHYAVQRGPRGQFLGAGGVAVDVSDRVGAAAARSASEAKSRFLAAMSHELRTPLNSVLGFSQLLLDPRLGELNERQQRYVSNILTSGRHLLALINDVLDLSKIEAGQMKLTVEEADLRLTATEAVDNMRPLAEMKKQNLRLVAPEPAVASTDRRRFAQVLLNLIANAVKFTPEGGDIEVRVAAAPDEVVVQVRDNGIGMAPKDLELIFNEFTQVEVGFTRPHEGTGLGLALSRRLMTLLGGDISVESELGQGSTFKVRLPRRARP